MSSPRDDGTDVSEVGARRPAGALEAEVMAALWAGDGPLTAAQVHAVLGDGLAYKTVLTVLGRLHAKGLVDREQAGRAHSYSPRRGPAEVAAEQMNAALRRGPQGPEVLQRFVDTLDPGEQAALRALLDPRD
jgi:predicted transcriptional regulator